MSTGYTFKLRDTGTVRRTPLRLQWEADYSSYPYDKGMDPEEAWAAWREQESSPTVPISWFVAGDGTFEHAPFMRDGSPNFLSYYTWPLDPAGSRLRWNDLPVTDGKSEWIVILTAWRPAPFTPEIPALVIEQAMGLVDYSAPTR